jgi:hypothetical protein
MKYITKKNLNEVMHWDAANAEQLKMAEAAFKQLKR